MISNLILKLPLLPGSLAMGMPSLATIFSKAGVITSGRLKLNVLPSRAVRENLVPVSASVIGIYFVTTKSLPSLSNTRCGFSSITNTRSAAAIWFGCSFPFSGKVTLVPFFQPTLTHALTKSSSSGTSSTYPSHASKRTRTSEKLCKDVFSISGIEVERSCSSGETIGSKTLAASSGVIWRRSLSFQAFFSCLIVDCPLLWITQNFISLSDLLELGFCFLLVVGILIRVPFHGQLPICLLQLIITRCPSNLQNV